MRVWDTDGTTLIGTLDARPVMTISQTNVSSIDTFADGRVRRILNVTRLFDITLDVDFFSAADFNLLERMCLSVTPIVITPDDTLLLSANGTLRHFPQDSQGAGYFASTRRYRIVSRTESFAPASLGGINAGVGWAASMEFRGTLV